MTDYSKEKLIDTVRAMTPEEKQVVFCELVQDQLQILKKENKRLKRTVKELRSENNDLHCSIARSSAAENMRGW